jgi:hypothetical protein
MSGIAVIAPLTISMVVGDRSVPRIFGPILPAPPLPWQSAQRLAKRTGPFASEPMILTAVAWKLAEPIEKGLAQSSEWPESDENTRPDSDPFPHPDSMTRPVKKRRSVLIKILI